MFSRAFPDLQWLKNQIESRFANQQGPSGQSLPHTGWPTVILNVEASNVHRDNIRGPLSLFTNVKGNSTVQTGNKSVKINEGFFYITNHDECYTLDIDSTQTETFNVHFGEHWADQVIRTITKRAEILFEEPFFIQPHQRFELHSKIYSSDNVVHALVKNIKSTVGQNIAEEENLYALLVHLTNKDQQVLRMMRAVPVVKNSTRVEIVKRLHSATDYIYSFYHNDLSLDELASVSCLSKFHFLRLFKIAFGKTPHQFISEVKVQQAQTMLKNSKIEINSIARTLGFASASSFSRTFYNIVGTYPSQWRN